MMARLIIINPLLSKPTLPVSATVAAVTVMIYFLTKGSFFNCLDISDSFHAPAAMLLGRFILPVPVRDPRKLTFCVGVEQRKHF